MAVTIHCTVCGQARTMPAAWVRKVKTPSCSRRCNGMLRGAEWKQHGHKGRAAWSDQSKAGYSEKMSGANNPAWKGGVTIFKKKGNYSGVRYVRAPTWAQPMARKDGYLMEHRLVMAEWCGYLLTRTEVVHHIDHDPARNPRSNLELWPDNQSHKLAEHGRFVEGAACRYCPEGLARP